MTTYRLNTVKLLADVDRVRRAGTPDEISLRQIAKEIGAGSSTVFTRLRAGQTPNVDTLCSLIMWLNPQASLADYVLPQGGRAARRELRQFPRTVGAMS